MKAETTNSIPEGMWAKSHCANHTQPMLEWISFVRHGMHLDIFLIPTHTKYLNVHCVVQNQHLSFGMAQRLHGFPSLHQPEKPSQPTVNAVNMSLFQRPKPAPCFWSMLAFLRIANRSTVRGSCLKLSLESCASWQEAISPALQYLISNPLGRDRTRDLHHNIASSFQTCKTQSSMWDRSYRRKSGIMQQVLSAKNSIQLKMLTWPRSCSS